MPAVLRLAGWEALSAGRCGPSASSPTRVHRETQAEMSSTERRLEEKGIVEKSMSKTGEKWGLRRGRGVGQATEHPRNDSITNPALGRLWEPGHRLPVPCGKENITGCKAL